MNNWSVLVTVAQSELQPAVTDVQSRQILDALGGGDSWVQYPPASGRGHGFETRWWQEGEDAASVGADATERFLTAVSAIGLDVSIVLVHVASAEDRLTETTIGLERRASTPAEADSWNVMLRAIAELSSERTFTRRDLDRLLELLPGAESSGYARDGLAEVRFWVDASDAVDATDTAARAFRAAMADLEHADWRIVRAHATSVAEGRRAGYLGVERRVASDRAALPIALRR